MTRTRGKERFKADAARRALLDAGWDILRDQGLSPGLGRVTLKEALERSGVARTTAYRVFQSESGALAAFQAALLEDLDRPVDADSSIELVASLLTDNEAVIASKDPAAMADLFREMIRVGFNDRLEYIAHRPEWRVYVSMAASLTDQDAGEGALRRGADKAQNPFVPLFSMLGELFGFRPSPPQTWENLAWMLVASIDGAGLRTIMAPDFAAIERTDGPGLDGGDWSGLAIIAEALFLVWCEPDPGAEATADLSRWTRFASQASD